MYEYYQKKANSSEIYNLFSLLGRHTKMFIFITQIIYESFMKIQLSKHE